MPLEGAGVILIWGLELPAAIRRIDFATITDVLLHVQYTAYERGPTLRAAANGAVKQVTEALDAEGQQQGFWAIWDLKNEFANEWSSLSASLVGEAVGQTMNLGDLKMRLPFWSRGKVQVEAHTIILMSKSQAILNKLDIQGASTKESWTDGSVGDVFMKICGASERHLDWQIETQVVATGWSEDDIENVYLLIHYVFAGKSVRCNELYRHNFDSGVEK